MSTVDIRYLNQFGMPGGFNITSGEPIDSRAYVADIEHIYSADNWKTVKPYNGLIVSAPDGQVRICVDAANYTSKDAWKEVGAGAGAIQVATYEEAIAVAVADKLGQIIYIENDGSFGEGDAKVDYTAGAYIVTGAGAISKLGTTSVSGDIAGDVETLKGDVATLKTDVDNLEEAVETINGNIDTINTTLEGLASKDEELEGAISTINGKLDNIEENAQVNVIETVKVNGVALEVTDKAVDVVIEAPVYNDAIVVAEDGTVTDGDNAPKTSAVVSYVADIKSGVDGSLETINELIESLDGKVNAIETWKLQVIPAEDKDKENFGLTEINSKTIYLVPMESTDTQNIYAEYVYVNSAWEKLGEFKADFDATELQNSITELGTKVSNIEAAIENINTIIEGINESLNDKIGKEDVMLDLSEATTEAYNLSSENLSTPALTGNFSIQSFEESHPGGYAVEVIVADGDTTLFMGAIESIADSFNCVDGVVTFKPNYIPEDVPATQHTLSGDLTIRLTDGVGTLSLTMNVEKGDKLNTQDSLVYLNDTKADKSELNGAIGDLTGKLNTTTATANAAAELAETNASQLVTVGTQIGDINTALENVAASLEGLTAKDGELEGAISDINGKLGDIEEGAEVNLVDDVKVEGVSIVDSSKVANLYYAKSAVVDAETGDVTTETVGGLMSAADKAKLDGIDKAKLDAISTISNADIDAIMGITPTE